MSFQLLEKKREENVYLNNAFSETQPRTTSWKEIPKTSIEVTNKTLITGNFGITVVEGKFLSRFETAKEPCAIKMLKGN